MRSLRRGLLPALSLLLTLAGACPAEIRIIAHPAIALTKLNVETVRRIYLGQQAHLGDDPLVPVVLSKEPTNEQFIEQFLGRTETQFTTYWRSRVFSGKGLPPKAFDSERAMLDFVRKTPGAIAFVDSTAEIEGVRVLEIER